MYSPIPRASDLLRLVAASIFATTVLQGCEHKSQREQERSTSAPLSATLPTSSEVMELPKVDVPPSTPHQGGYLGLGQQCTFDAQCASSSICKITSCRPSNCPPTGCIGNEPRTCQEENQVAGVDCSSPSSCKISQCDSGGNCAVTPINKPAGSTCNDGNACTTSDQCNSSGVCGGTAVTCNSPPNTQCYNATGTCNTSTGACQYTTKAANTVCNDGNACTTGDKCNSSGVCGGTAVTCNSPPNAQCYNAAGACNTSTGACQYTAKPVNTACNDGNACTSGDKCDSNARCFGAVVNPDDGNPCTADSCNIISGVAHVPLQQGASCNDNNACTTQDHCDGAGTCLGVTNATNSCGISPPPEPNPSFRPDLAGGPTKEVGTIAGQFAVTPSGAATYSIPFEVPAGRAGLTPALGLAYSSDRGNGIAGMGFSLSGLSAISRCPKTQQPDGVVREVRYDAQDKFCLDGTPLVEVSAGSGEYRTIPDQFSKILARTESGVVGPSWFEVQTRDGRTLFYGKTPAQGDGGARAFGPGGAVRSWALRSVKDRYVNSIWFTYGQTTQPSQSGPPTSVEQVLNQVTYSPNNHLLFGYEDRPDPSLAYSKGIELRQTKRLTSVRVLSDGRALRQYNLTYEDPASHPSGRSRLAKIQECTVDEPVVCKPDTRFTWNNGQVGFNQAETAMPAPNDLMSVLTAWDHNRDGLSDLVSMNFEQKYGVVVDSEGSDVLGHYDWPFFSYSINRSGSYLSVDPQPYTYLNKRWSYYDQVPNGDFKKIRMPPFLTVVFDYDGDGSDDLVSTNLFHRTSTGDRQFTYISGRHVGDSVAGFRTDPNISVPYTGFIPSTSVPPGVTPTLGSLHFLDATGDGVMDMVQCWPPSTDASGNTVPEVWIFAPHGGLGYSDQTTQVIHQLQGTPCDRQAFVLDEDGDGRQELVIRPSLGTGFQPPYLAFGLTTVTSQVGTLRTEILVRPSAVPTEHLYADQGEHTVFPMDVNGDGLTDLVATSHGGSKLVTYINSGGAFLPGVLSLPDVVLGQRDTTPQQLRMSFTLDYNGDGRLDLVIPDVSLTYWDVLCSQPGTVQWKRVPWVFPFVNPYSSPDIDPFLPPPGVRYQAQKTVDINGDGVTDVFGVSNGKVHTWTNQLKEEDTLRTISDGLRSHEKGEDGYKPTIQINYDHLSRGLQTGLYSISSYSCTYPMRCVVGPRRVVSSYLADNGLSEDQNNNITGTNVFHFTYKDGREDRLGQRWLGFKERTIKQFIQEDENRTITTIEKYDLNEFVVNELLPKTHYPHAHKLTSRQVTAQDNGKISSTFDRITPAIRVSGARTTYFTYDTQRQHREFEGVSLNVSVDESFTVDDFGNVLTKTIPGLRTETNEYLNDTTNWLIGRLTKSKVCENSAAFASYDGCGTSTLTYTTQGALASITVDPDLPATWLRTSLFYDTFGNVIGATAQDYENRTRTSWIFYDDQGWFPYARQNALGHVLFEKYDGGFGVLLQHIDANNAATLRSYDRFGRLTSEVSPDGVVHTIERERIRTDDNEIVTSLRSSSSLGEESISLVNSVGQVKQAKTRGFGGAWYVQDLTYDVQGRLQTQSLPSSAPQSPIPLRRYERDLIGRVVRVIEPDQATTQIDYSQPQQIITTDAKGNKSSKTFDTFGRIVKAIDGLGTPQQAQTLYSHGAFGSLKVTAPGNAITTSGRNWRGQLIYSADPDRGWALLAHNGFGEVTREENPLFNVSFTYDALGRPIRRVSGTETAQWTWDTAANGIGHLASSKSADLHEEAYAYDTIGRLAAIHTTPYSSTGSPTTYSTRFEYDLGRLKRIYYPRAANEPELVIQYGYDAWGQLTGAYEVVPGFRPQRIWQWTQADAQGNPTHETFGNGLNTVREYYLETGLLKKISTAPGTAPDSPIQSLSYTYEPNHNVQSRTDDLQALTETFQYDPLDRVTKATVGTRERSYAYDASGNITAMGVMGVVSPPWEYDPAHPHAVTKAVREGTTYSFAYDTLGRQKQRPGATIEYNSFNKPTRYTPTFGSSAPAALFTYDAQGNRLTKKVSQGSTPGTTLYIQQLYERFTDDTTGAQTLKYFVQTPERTVASIVYKREASSSPLPWTKSFAYIHPDHLGSPTLLTGGQGQVLERRSYDAFGKRRSASNWWSAAAGSPEALQVSGYTGHEEDEELGLVNMKGRIYDPQVARFLTADPLVQAPLFSQSWNRYAYVFNNPLKFTDPSGFASCPLPTDNVCFDDDKLTTPVPKDSEPAQTDDGPAASQPPANASDPLAGSDSYPIPIDPRVAIRIEGPPAFPGERWNPYNPFGSGSDYGFGSPKSLPISTLTKEQEFAIGDAFFKFIPGLHTYITAKDPNSTTADIVLSAAMDTLTIATIGATLYTGVGRAAPNAIAAAQLTEDMDLLAQYAPKVDVVKDGFYNVVLHADPHKAFVLRNEEWIELNHRALARFIRGAPGYNGQPVRLVACNSGGCPTGLAQHLSNKLGVSVLAPTTYVEVTSYGNYWLKGPGSWVLFKPTPIPLEVGPMTYYPDNSACDYYGALSGSLLAIGWLDKAIPFSKGAVAPDFFLKLVHLLRDPWQPSVLAGYHRCPFCRFTGGPTQLFFDGSSVLLGNLNVFVPSSRGVYVAPSTIVHYIDAHEYCPPKEFQEAVMVCPEMKSFQYLKGLKAHGILQKK